MSSSFPVSSTDENGKYLNLLDNIISTNIFVCWGNDKIIIKNSCGYQKMPLHDS